MRCAILITSLCSVTLSYKLTKQRTSSKFKLCMSDPVLNKYSRIITEPPSQGASQAMLYATGLNPKTITNPQIGICSVWFEG